VKTSDGNTILNTWHSSNDVTQNTEHGFVDTEKQEQLGSKLCLKKLAPIVKPFDMNEEAYKLWIGAQI
jgi:hypothetical protein